ncbi:MAG: hypothetical protein EXS48_02630 [Candidatus Staskawiczbacteria bacterium]|nr:hypothetical protein [Candidatus Staskawiczbacteria bacterium]
MRIIRKTLKLLLVPIEKILFEVVKNIPTGPLQKTVHIVRADTIGDFVLFSATLPYYKKIYPGYKIVLIGDAVWEELALLVQENKLLDSDGNYFDELIAVNGKDYNRSPFYYYKILKKIRLSAPEIVIQVTFSRTEKSDRWVLVSRESKKIGYEGDISNITAVAKAKNDAKYDRLIQNPASGLESDRNKHFINELVSRPIMESGLPHWNMPERLLVEGRDLLTSAGANPLKPVLVICPNGSEPKRSWTIENFISLITALYKRDNSFQFVLIGGPRDVEDCVQIQELLKEKGIKSHNLSGKKTLSKFAKILSVSNIFIGAETGSMHMASAIGIPVVVLRWEGHYERFFPYPAWRAGSENAVILQKRDESDGSVKLQDAFNQIIGAIKR